MNPLAKWKFNSPGRIVFGNGSSKETGKYLEKMGSSRCLIITDPGIAHIGILEDLVKAIKGYDISYAVYDNVQPEPVEENVIESVDIFKNNNCDSVVGIGGGSAIDVAKAVAMLAKNGGKFANYVGIDKVPIKGFPLIALPTTAGTGSEASIFSIILVNGSKMGVVDSFTAADYAIVDPLLTVTVPRKLTAATGIDAFLHHLESYISINATPFCEVVCLEGIHMISKYLRRAVGNGNDVEARYWMSYASTLGGLAMNMTEGAAAIHGLGFALGARFHVPHGMANAVMLPKTLKAVAGPEYERLVRVGEAMELPSYGLSVEEAAEKTIAAICKLVADVGCFIPLREFGVKEDDIDGLVEETLTQTRVMGHSTYQLTKEEIYKIFKDSL